MSIEIFYIFVCLQLTSVVFYLRSDASGILSWFTVRLQLACFLQQLFHVYFHLIQALLSTIQHYTFRSTIYLFYSNLTQCCKNCYIHQLKKSTPRYAISCGIQDLLTLFYNDLWVRISHQTWLYLTIILLYSYALYALEIPNLKYHCSQN